MVFSVKKDDCIWFKHLSPELQRLLSRLRESETVRLTVNDQETVWCRMRNGPHGPTHGIRITSGAEIWRAIPRGSEFRVAPATSSGATEIETEHLAGHRPLRKLATTATCGNLFGEYFFADYSGAATVHGQRKSIKIAVANGHLPASLDPGTFTRESLVEWMHQRLLAASARGVRVCFGQDHSYGFPLAFGRELGIAGLPWRSAIASFLDGGYASDAPHFKSVPQFAVGVNSWLRSHGLADYFWSSTQKGYGLPSRNPRGRATEAYSRVTETRRSSLGRASPMPFGRLGDKGSVGGQALWGLTMIRQLIARCDREGVPLRCWPFDGLALSSKAYDNAHVLIEAYPSALRAPTVAQSDEADALCTVEALQLADAEGRLRALLDLSGIAVHLQPVVQYEGWIIGQQI